MNRGHRREEMFMDNPDRERFPGKVRIVTRFREQIMQR